MTVTVTPEQFSLVDFEAPRIASVVEMLLPRVGFPDDTDVCIEVNETTPMGRVRLVALDPISITAESGALEDPKAPRQLSEPEAAEAIGRMLLMARDRLDESFGAPEIDDEIPGGVSMAWDVYCVSRLGRAGYPVMRQRRLHHFRNRFGFTDVADAAFDRVWSADVLTYADLVQIATDAVSGESAVGIAPQP